MKRQAIGRQTTHLDRPRPVCVALASPMAMQAFPSCVSRRWADGCVGCRLS